MIAYDKRSNCKRARLCYYDLLDTEIEADAPEDVRRHIDSCQHCQTDMSQLRALLASTDKTAKSEQEQRDLAISTLLSLHFAWIDRPVTCQSAKPFLPSLADPILQITIPTPITVHLDKCPRCSGELATLKSSGFTHKQLCRLGGIMAEQQPEDIAERDDSGITTCFTFREQGQQSAQTESNEYANWPIEVQVLSREGLGSTKAARSSAPRQRTSLLNLKRQIKPALAAAAMILIGVAFFFGTSAARAVDLDRIYKAVMRAPNIHITNFISGETGPERERWASRSLRMYMLKVGQELTLWDFRAGSRKVKSFHNVAPKAVPLTETDAATAKKTINSPLDIMPFNNMSDVPADAKWDRVADDAVQAATLDCQVYDLTWARRGSRGETILEKWRVFVDSNTNLPQKAQFYDKFRTDTEYALQNELVAEYLSDRQVEAAVKEAFP